jgi:hypothetical protein
MKTIKGLPVPYASDHIPVVSDIESRGEECTIRKNEIEI